VTFPWLSAHSIRKRIGGDIYILVSSGALSRDNFGMCRKGLRID
jgi:hypothetical protein